MLSETASSAFQLGVQYATELACNVVNKAIVDMRLRPRPVMPWWVSLSIYRSVKSVLLAVELIWVAYC